MLHPQLIISILLGNIRTPTDLFIVKDGIYLPLTTELSYVSLKNMYQYRTQYRTNYLCEQNHHPRFLTVTLIGTNRNAILQQIAANSTLTTQNSDEKDDTNAKVTKDSLFRPVRIDSEQSWQGFLKLCMWKMRSDGIEKEQRALGVVVEGKRDTHPIFQTHPAH